MDDPAGSLAELAGFSYFCPMNLNRWIIGLVALPLLLAGCAKQVPDEYGQLDDETKLQRKYVNTFAWNVMDTYYLWRDEIASALEKWKNWEEPVRKVADIRYKDAAGKDIDRWTLLTDDYASLIGGVSGHTRTIGMDFNLYFADKAKTRICAVVTYTYNLGPAAQAGLGRGDIILAVDGREMTPDNYKEIVRDRLLGGGTVKLGLSDGRSVTVTAVDMYEDPVQTIRILERPGGKKVGYLHYTSFTLEQRRLPDRRGGAGVPAGPRFRGRCRPRVVPGDLWLRDAGGGPERPHPFQDRIHVPQGRRPAGRVHGRGQSGPAAPVCPRDGEQRIGLGEPGLRPASVYGRHPGRRTHERQVLRRLSDRGHELV